jgi:predicted heme/steroid binding protein
VQGANSAGKSNVASATVSVLPDSAIGLYDGIYVWSDGNYLSLHQDGQQMIATIYFNDNTSVDFKAASGGVLKVPQLDIFDLLSGAMTGTTAKVSGTRFHRACNVSYDFAFNESSKLTVTRTNVSNTAIANTSGISCSSIIANESPTMTMSKVPFGAAASTPAFAVGQYDGIYVWADGNYLSLHQDGADFIATNYFNDNTSVDFRAASGGVLTVPQLDVFDLLSGAVTGSTAKIKGTRFHRACNVTYDFAFSGNVNITATRTGITNTPLADAAGISCSALLGSESGTITMQKVLFGR